MRIYMAYKYKSVPNKEQLINDLNDLSDQFSGLGHAAFILGRDIQDWSSTTPLWKTIPQIVINLFKSHLVFVYIQHDGETVGLPIELTLAKLLNKNIVIAVKKEYENDKHIKWANTLITFNDLAELKAKIKETFSGSEPFVQASKTDLINN